MKHPDIATGFKLNGKGLKTAYMSLLLSLIETLRRPPLSFSDIELSKANSTLRELTEAGFKLDWLKKKLEEVSLARKNDISDGSQVEELEEHVKNLKLELDNEKIKSSTASERVLLLEKEVLDLKIELDRTRRGQPNLLYLKLRY